MLKPLHPVPHIVSMATREHPVAGISSFDPVAEISTAVRVNMRSKAVLSATHPLAGVLAGVWVR